VERKYRREFSVCIAPLGAAICRIVGQSEEVGSVLDKCAKGRKRSASVRREEFVGAAWEAITKSPRNRSGPQPALLGNCIMLTCSFLQNAAECAIGRWNIPFAREC
jgi:hypothetical protein